MIPTPPIQTVYQHGISVLCQVSDFLLECKNSWCYHFNKNSGDFVYFKSSNPCLSGGYFTTEQEVEAGTAAISLRNDTDTNRCPSLEVWFVVNYFKHVAL